MKKQVSQVIRRQIDQHTKLALLARVSTEEQAEAQTIESQIAMLQKWAWDRGIQVVAQYLDDGVSGTVPFDQRPACQQALRDAKAGVFDLLVCGAVDRLGRGDVGDTINAVYGLYGAGATTYFLKESLHYCDPKDAITLFNLTIFGGVAQLEHATIRERTTRGRKHHARKGEWVHGRLPFGYAADGDKKPVLDDTWIEQVQMKGGELARDILLKLASGDWSTKGVARWLNSIGVPSFTRYSNGTVVPGNGWNDNRIWKMVQNSTYYGEHWVNPTDDDAILIPAPALVTQAELEAARQHVRNNRTLATRNATYPYLLRGLFRCECGYQMVGCTITVSGIRRPYYRCNSASDRADGKPITCRAKMIPAADIEAQVWEKVKDFLLNPGPYLAEYRRQRKARLDKIGNVEERKVQLLKRRQELLAERQEIIRMRRKQQITEAEADDQFSDIKQQAGYVESELAELQARQELAEAIDRDAQQTEAYLAQHRAQVADIEADPEYTRKVFQALIHGLVLHTEGVGWQKKAHCDVFLKLEGPNTVCVPLTKSATQQLYTNEEGACPVGQAPVYVYPIRFAAN